MIDKILKLLFKEKSVITINGVNYSGRNVQMDGTGNLIIDGNHVTQIESKNVVVTVIGNVEELSTTNGDVSVVGAVDVSSTNGDINISGSVTGNVSTTNGNVQAKEIHGKVKTVNGNIKTK